MFTFKHKTPWHFLGPVHFITVNTIETALEVLVRKSTDFAGRMLTPSRKLLSSFSLHHA
jgi:hypothetical protein